VVQEKDDNRSSNNKDGGKKPAGGINHDVKNMGYAHHVQEYLTMPPHGVFKHMHLQHVRRHLMADANVRNILRVTQGRSTINIPEYSEVVLDHSMINIKFRNKISNIVQGCSRAAIKIQNTFPKVRNKPTSG
jgi:hypothetical protein